MDPTSIATHVIDSAVEIHRKIGPGLRDSVYATSIAQEADADLSEAIQPETRSVDKLWQRTAHREHRKAGQRSR